MNIPFSNKKQRAVVPEPNLLPVNKAELIGKAIWDSFFISTSWQTGLMQMFNLCPPVSNVINKRATYASNVKFKLQNVNTLQFVDNDPLLDRLNNPNQFQSKNEFVKLFVVFVSIFGRANMYINRGVGSTNLKNHSFFWLNPDFEKYNLKGINMFAESKKTLSLTIDYIDENSNSYKIPYSDIITNFDVANTTILDGISRVEFLKYPISNIIKCLEGENTIISRPGGIGIISKRVENGMSIPLLDEEKKAILNKLQNDYGISREKANYIVTSSAIEVNNLLRPIGDFGFTETYNRNELAIVNQFNMPGEVYGTKTGTYENTIEAKRGYYQDEVSPLIQNFCDNVANFYGYNLKNLRLIADYSHLPIFSENKNTKVDTFVKLFDSLIKGGFTKDEALKFINNYGI